MAAREALIIASAQYSDPVLHKLCAPVSDARSLGEVLSNPAIGNFQVKELIDKPHDEVAFAIDEFFDDRHPDDLLLLYFSGHGIKDVDGRLYFATADTRRTRLLSTAVAASLVNEIMQRSRSRSQLLILDCCYSGAFARGMVAKSDNSVGTLDQFPGTGRVVLTASDATQFSLEPEVATADCDKTLSVFTESVIEGLRTGNADINRDGHITLDELYEYTLARVLARTPAQKPMKWVLGATGEIIIAHNPKPLAEPAKLSPTLIGYIDNSNYPAVRRAAVDELGKLLHNRNRVVVNAAEVKLKELLEDDSFTIRKMAQEFLAEKGRRDEEERERQALVEKARQDDEEARRRRVASGKTSKERQELELLTAIERMALERAAAEAGIREENEERERQAAAEKALAETYKQEERRATDKIRLKQKQSKPPVGEPQAAATAQPTGEPRAVAVMVRQEKEAQPDHTTFEETRREEEERFRIAAAGNTDQEETDRGARMDRMLTIFAMVLPIIVIVAILVIYLKFR